MLQLRFLECRKIQYLYSLEFLCSETFLHSVKFLYSETFLYSDKSSRPKRFCKKSVLKNFVKFTGKHLCQSLFFNRKIKPLLIYFLPGGYSNAAFLPVFRGQNVVSKKFSLINFIKVM